MSFLGSLPSQGGARLSYCRHIFKASYAVAPRRSRLVGRREHDNERRPFAQRPSTIQAESRSPYQRRKAMQRRQFLNTLVLATAAGSLVTRAGATEAGKPTADSLDPGRWSPLNAARLQSVLD